MTKYLNRCYKDCCKIMLENRNAAGVAVGGKGSIELRQDLKVRVYVKVIEEIDGVESIRV